MRNVMLAMCVAWAVPAPSGVAAALPPPSLAGHWRIDPRPSPDTWVVPFCGLECTIAQDQTTLTVTPQGHDAKHYTLDGSPATTTESAFGYLTKTVTAAKWDQGTLVVTTTLSTTREDDPAATPTAPTTSTTRLALQDGRLTIEYTSSLRGGRGGDGPTKQVYARVK